VTRKRCGYLQRPKSRYLCRLEPFGLSVDDVSSILYGVSAKSGGAAGSTHPPGLSSSSYARHDL
jgi:hypothetical protein